MKLIFLRMSVIILLIVCTVSCSSNESSDGSEIATDPTTSTTTTTTTTTTNTWVKLTVLNSAGVLKPNYKILMFATQPKANTALPQILKEVTTDKDGLGYFDLNEMITSSTSKTYYFEAFIKNGTDYNWESTSHFNCEILKGKMITSSIIVN